MSKLNDVCRPPFKIIISSTALQDQKFISKLKEGHQDAFRTLVETHKDQIYNTCLGLLRNPQDAEDTAQEVFISVFNEIQHFKGTSSLRTWIYRIAVNKSLEVIRHRKRQKRASFFKALKNEDNALDELEDANAYVHPGINLENKERARLLMNAIERLPDQQRIAFVLHKIEGLKYKMIAEVMEKSLSAVESLLHRARQNLRDQLYEYYNS